MNILDLTVFICVFGLIAIVIHRAYNLLTSGKAYEKRIGILTFIASIALYTLILLTALADYNNIYFSILLKYGTYLFVLNLFMTLTEFLYIWSDVLRWGRPSYRPGRE